jgi:hypothetical protein
LPPVEDVTDSEEALQAEKRKIDAVRKELAAAVAHANQILGKPDETGTASTQRKP